MLGRLSPLFLRLWKFLKFVFGFLRADAIFLIMSGTLSDVLIGGLGMSEGLLLEGDTSALKNNFKRLVEQQIFLQTGQE